MSIFQRFHTRVGHQHLPFFVCSLLFQTFVACEEPKDIPEMAFECDPSDNCCESNGRWKNEKVRQLATDLYWQRCPIGQTWTTGASCGCAGTTTVSNWCNATGKDVPDYCTASNPGKNICEDTFSSPAWRLPTNEEFRALLEINDVGAGLECDGDDGITMCTEMFGNVPGHYWSSDLFSNSHAFLVSFSNAWIVSEQVNMSNSTRCLRKGFDIYTCRTIYMGGEGCMDFLEADGWNQLDATDWCNFWNEGEGVTASVIDETGTCKNTVDQSDYPFRCVACEYEPSDPAPRSCIGRKFYFYPPDPFPPFVCTDYFASEIEWAPWPIY